MLQADLIFVGRKLAVLGVDPDDLMGPWHILNPGSFSAPQVGSQGQAIGRSLCGRFVITNGYASDFNPGKDATCPACSERV